MADVLRILSSNLADDGPFFVSMLVTKELLPMRLSGKSLTYLRDFITGDDNRGPRYRSGPVLVRLFNDFGFNDEYGQGFPSRWKYVEDKLRAINGTDQLRKLVATLFSPIEFLDSPTSQQQWVDGFNKYLAFDGLQLSIQAKKCLIISSEGATASAETVSALDDDFVREQFEKVEKKIAEGDYDGAITNSRSMVEGVIGFIYENGTGEVLPKTGDLLGDFKKIRTLLEIADKNDEPLRQVLNGLASIIQGMDTLSNRMGDRHRRHRMPEQYEARLVVNAAKTICDFIIHGARHSQSEGGSGGPT